LGSAYREFLKVTEKISVIIAVESSRERMQQAVESVLSQRSESYELIIVDEEFSPFLESASNTHSNIKLVCQPNRGIACARNAGLGAASGEFIAFLDPDDRWMPGKLAAQLDVFRTNADIAFCFTEFSSASVVDVRESAHSKLASLEQLFEIELDAAKIRTFRRKAVERDVAALMFLEEQCIPLSTVMIRRSCLPYTGLFDPMLGIGASCDMWVKILRHFNAAQVMEHLVTCFSRELAGNEAAANAFDHSEIYQKYIQYGSAVANEKLVAFARSLLERSAHTMRCHRFA